MSDSNGVMVGLEFYCLRGGGMRLRVVYAGGDVSHTIPSYLVGKISRDAGRLPAFFRDGRGRRLRFGDWSGPE